MYRFLYSPTKNKFSDNFAIHEIKFWFLGQIIVTNSIYFISNTISPNGLSNLINTRHLLFNKIGLSFVYLNYFIGSTLNNNSFLLFEIS